MIRAIVVAASLVVAICPVASDASLSAPAPADEPPTCNVESVVALPQSDGPPADEMPACWDSDGSLEDADIYRRGYVEVESPQGTGRSTDHCRGDKLVEYSCVEDPDGSGRLIEDARMVRCPGTSRCAGGECVY